MERLRPLFCVKPLSFSSHSPLFNSSSPLLKSHLLKSLTTRRSYHPGKSWPGTVHSPEFTSSSDDILQSLLEERSTTVSGLGVLRKDKREDLRLMISSYTAPSLAAALRDREDTLQYAATLLKDGSVDAMQTLADILSPHEEQYIEQRRRRKVHLDLEHGFSTDTLEMLRKYLARMPRQVTKAHRHRAAVVLPLCNVSGVPSVLFEKRSLSLRKHPGEVCFPGGMVAGGEDTSIVRTCLREMEEEVGLRPDEVNVLGILRCNWGEITAITGIAVTPVIGYVGELGDVDLPINEDEVAECFSVPLIDLVNKENWVHQENASPIFTGGPHVVWGLTAYILDRFIQDVLKRYRISFSVDPSGMDKTGEEEEEEQQRVKTVERRLSSFNDFKF